MRFPIAAVVFLAMSFIFFVTFAVGHLVLSEVDDAFDPYDDDLDASFGETVTLLKDAFGIIGAIFFVSGILIFFVMDSFSDEDELYYRER